MANLCNLETDKTTAVERLKLLEVDLPKEKAGSAGQRASAGEGYHQLSL